MKNILITGSSGFIGTNLVSKLIQTVEYNLLGLDLVAPKISEHNAIWKQVDITDQDALSKCINDFDPNIVIHLAARTDLNGKTIENYNSNAMGVSNLIEVLKELKLIERVVFASSMYVCQPGYAPKDFDDYKPHTVYGESKVLTEKIINENNPSYIWSIIRPTSIWGPYFGEPYNLFFQIVLSRKYFHMGDKACRKTYGYIDNFIYQIESIIKANKKEIDKKVFYLGDYEPYDITSWANEIAEYKQIKIPNIPYSLFKMAGFFGDLLKTVGVKFPMTSFRLRNMTTDNFFDLDPIKKIAPELPISRKDGTKITVDWMVDNEFKNQK
jgi:nucleoside-diphosphate-sugar epimerase